MAVGRSTAPVVTVGARISRRQMDQSIPSGLYVRASASGSVLPCQRLNEVSVDRSVHQKRRAIVRISLSRKRYIQYVHVIGDRERLVVTTTPPPPLGVAAAFVKISPDPPKLVLFWNSAERRRRLELLSCACTEEAETSHATMNSVLITIREFLNIRILLISFSVVGLDLDLMP